MYTIGGRVGPEAGGVLKKIHYEYKIRPRGKSVRDPRA